MNILFIGDISGDDGKRAIKENLSKIKNEYKINFVIANAENTTNGRGLSKEDYNELKEMGINFFTMGNHTWFQKDYSEVLSNNDIIRPGNLSEHSTYSKYGIGSKLIDINGQKIRITNILGSSIILKNNESIILNPFNYLEDLINNIEDDSFHIVDFHSETTSEKNAFIHNFKNRLGAILGTHTHVQTADNRIIDNTAYITDVGMTGNADGVIGANPITIVEMFRGERKFFKLEPNYGNYQFSAVILKINNNVCSEINRILIYENNIIK